MRPTISSLSDSCNRGDGGAYFRIVRTRVLMPTNLYTTVSTHSTSMRLPNCEFLRVCPGRTDLPIGAVKIPKNPAVKLRRVIARDRNQRP